MLFIIMHVLSMCVIVCVCVKNGRRITDPGKSIDRDRRIYLLEGQKWRDEMNEGRERDIEKKVWYQLVAN